MSRASPLPRSGDRSKAVMVGVIGTLLVIWMTSLDHVVGCGPRRLGRQTRDCQAYRREYRVFPANGCPVVLWRHSRTESRDGSRLDRYVRQRGQGRGAVKLRE